MTLLTTESPLLEYVDGWKYRQGSELIPLTRTEAQIVIALASNAGECVSRYILPCSQDSNSVHVMISRLRKKLGADRIITHRKIGYEWRAE